MLENSLPDRSVVERHQVGLFGPYLVLFSCCPLRTGLCQTTRGPPVAAPGEPLIMPTLATKEPRNSPKSANRGGIIRESA